MKKILYSLIMLLAGVAMFTACDEDNPTYIAPAKLDIKSADAFYEAVGGSGTIVVNTTDEITASADVDWISANVDGNTVTITVAANYNLEGRSGNVILKSASASSKINVTQMGSIYDIDLGDGKLLIADTDNSSISIPVTHTHEVIVESLTSWLTAVFDEENSQIVIVAAANNDVDSRTGRVAFSTGVIKDTLYITQQGMQFRLAKESVFSTNEGGTFSVELLAVKEVNVESSAAWVVAVYDEAKGVIELTVEANTAGAPRSAEVTLTSGEAELSLTVSQYDFAKELYGDYVLVYYDTDFKPATMDAMLTSEGLTFGYPVSETAVLPYTVPVVANETEGTAAFGPNGSFLGMYSSYYIYLRFADLQEEDLVSADFADQSMAEGILSFEEEEDEETGEPVTTTYLDFEGTFADGNAEISLWILAATSSEGFIEDNYKAPLDFLISPFLIKVPADEAPAVRRASAVKSFNSLVKKRAQKRQNWQLPALLSK